MRVCQCALSQSVVNKVVKLINIGNFHESQVISLPYNIHCSDKDTGQLSAKLAGSSASWSALAEMPDISSSK